MAEQTEDILLNSRDLRRRGLGSRATVHRRLNDPNFDFPRPIKICGRNYWRRSVIENWIERQTAKSAEAVAADAEQAHRDARAKKWVDKFVEGRDEEQAQEAQQDAEMAAA